MSKESTKSAKVAYLKSKEGRSNVINCFWAIIIAIIFLFPIYWLIQMSFKTDMESFGKIVTYYPHEFTVDPWLQNLQDKDFITSLKKQCIDCFVFHVFITGIRYSGCLWYGSLQSKKEQRASCLPSL